MQETGHRNQYLESKLDAVECNRENCNLTSQMLLKWNRILWSALDNSIQEFLKDSQNGMGPLITPPPKKKKNTTALGSSKWLFYSNWNIK